MIIGSLSLVSAGDIYVDPVNGNDDNDGSVDTTKLSIKNASDSSVANDIIYLNKGIYKTSSNTNISINHNLSFYGLGSADEVVIDAEYLSDNLFNISDGCTVNFYNITFKNFFFDSNSTSSSTMSIVNGQVSINNCVFLENRQLNTNETYCRGTIFVSEDSSLTLINSDFINNTGRFGAAIYNDGILNIYSSSFVNNNGDINTVNNARVGGALIYSNDSSRLYIDNSIFDSNNFNGWDQLPFATLIYIGKDNNAEITNSTFKNNYLQSTVNTDESIYFAPIINFAEDFSVINSNFIGNNVTGSAAIYNLANGLYVADSTFSDNYYGNLWKESGSIYNSGNNSIVINSTFERNILFGLAKIAIVNNKLGVNFTVSDCKFLNNSHNNNTDQRFSGACVVNSGPNSTVINSIFEDNVFWASTAIYNWGSGENFTVSDSVFINNKADYVGISGAVIYNAMANFKLLNSSFINNTGIKTTSAMHLRYGGGVLLNWAANNVIISGCEFINNSINNDLGNVIYNYNGENFTINYNHFYTPNGNDVNSTVSSLNADYNWWGENDYTSHVNVTVNNYYVIKANTTVNNTDDFELGKFKVSYYFVLNDTEDNTNAELLPFLELIVSNNGDSFVADGRSSQVFDLDVNTVGQNTVELNLDDISEVINFNATKIALEIVDVEVPSGNYGETVNIKITLKEEFNGILNVTVNDVTKEVTFVDGVGNYSYLISNAGNTPINVFLNGSTNGTDSAFNLTTTFSKRTSSLETILNAVVTTNNNKVTATVTLIGANGKALANKTITLVLGTIKKTVTTDSNGKATYTFTVSKTGKYNFKATFNPETITNETEILNLPSSTFSKSVDVKILKPTNIKATVKTSTKKIKKVKYTLKKYSYKNIGDIKGSKTFTVKIPKGYKYVKSTKKGLTFKYSSKKKVIKVKVKNLKSYSATKKVVKLVVYLKKAKKASK